MWWCCCVLGSTTHLDGQHLIAEGALDVLTTALQSRGSGSIHRIDRERARVPTVETVHLQVSRLEPGVGGLVGLVRGLLLLLLLLLLVVVGALLLLVIGSVLRVQNLLELIKNSITTILQRPRPS